MSSTPPLHRSPPDDAGRLASLVPLHLTIVAADKGSVHESLAHLGPIDFDVLRASIRRVEDDPEIDQAALRFVARELPRIAAARAQRLSTDIQDFVAGHSD